MVLDINNPKFLHLLQKGDEHAWEKFLSENKTKLSGIIFGILNDERETLDCYDDFVHKLFKDKIHQYKPTGSFWWWLKEATINHTLNWKKKKRNFVPLDDLKELPEVTEVNDPLNILERKELKELFDDIFEKSKNDKYIQVVRLKILEEFQYGEIANLLRQPVPTIRVYFQRGKEKLKRIIKKKYSSLLEDYESKD